MLSGPIPGNVGTSHKKMITFDVQSNSLTGTLPESFREMSSLVTLSLGENSFSGTVPRDLGNLAGLKFLYADNNHLVGLLPPSLARSGVIVNNGVNEKTEKKNDVAIGSAMVSYIFSLYYKLSRGGPGGQ